MKLTIRYSKLGKVRFTSHRDAARLWERALRKARIPVAMSAGFTPRPKISFGLALPTGAESVGEYVDVELADGHVADRDELAIALSQVLPSGIEVVDVVEWEPGGQSLQQAVIACTWEIELRGISVQQAAASAADIIAADVVHIERERKGERRVDDIRPALESLWVDDVDGCAVLVAVVATTGRGLRPAELVSALFPPPAHPPAEELIARVLRTHQWIDDNGARRDVIPLGQRAGRA